MKKVKIAILVAASLLLVAGAQTAWAMLLPAAEKAKEQSRANNSPINEKVTTDGETHLVLNPPGLEKIVFIHYRKGYGKPPEAGAGKLPKAPACYGFLGKGVKWQTLPVNYFIDPDNPDGLTEEFVTSAISAGAEEWDSKTSSELFGSYTIDYNSSWDINAPDGRNELLFGDYQEANVIAVTVVWGYFTGPPQTRRIVEFDVLFDIDFSPWGDASSNSALMDLQNIATHEIGHGAGLADVYQTVCSEVTMYGYSNYGETKKRTLELPDITGIQSLYGQ